MKKTTTILLVLPKEERPMLAYEFLAVNQHGQQIELRITLRHPEIFVTTLLNIHGFKSVEYYLL